MSNRSSQDELPARSTTNTQTFLETFVFDDHKALEEHLMSNPVQQSDLDRCLLRGLRIMPRKRKRLPETAQTLKLLLQSGAKWNNDVLLADQMTPLHVICESPGDHHELLDLMIKSSQRAIIDLRDVYKRTALTYAVVHANIKCLKSLIISGADIFLEDDRHQRRNLVIEKGFSIIKLAILQLSSFFGHPAGIMGDIIDLLLDTVVKKNKDHFRSCTAYIQCAVHVSNVPCIKKLIKIGAPLDVIAADGLYVWASVAIEGSVELLSCMFNHGIDKDSTDQNGVSIFGHVVTSGNIDAVRYLLDLGVDIHTYIPDVLKTRCEWCKEDMLIIDDDSTRGHEDPCMIAIHHNMWEIVKLLDKYGSQTCKSFYSLRRAVKYGSVSVVSYLLNKYAYPLNIEYKIKDSNGNISTLLKELFVVYKHEIVMLLFEHGFDLGKPKCLLTSANSIMAAILYSPLAVIAQYIRSGANFKFRLLDSAFGCTSPFEAAVLHDRQYAAIMLLMSGCSSGVSSTIKFKTKPSSRLVNLMMEWNVYDNNVTSLKQQCRSVILNHLSPRADMKIRKLPLPSGLVKFLSIPELDNFVDAYCRIRDVS